MTAAVPSPDDIAANKTLGDPGNICHVVEPQSQLSTLAEALGVASLCEFVLLEKGPYTLFAPSNKAFAKLPAATLSRILDPGNDSELGAILDYHIAPGSLFSNLLSNGESIPTLSQNDSGVVDQVNVTIAGSSVHISNALVTTGAEGREAGFLVAMGAR